jgi:Tfp pilus assembly PilM family ATPase
MFGTRGHIGLDISTNSIRAVETENKPTPVIQKIGVSRPVDGTIIDGAVAKPEELVKALREAAIDCSRLL